MTTHTDEPGKDRAEEKLRASEKLLAQAEELANIGSWELNVEKQTVTWSAHFYQMLGREPETGPIPYGSITQLIHPDDWERALRDGEEMKVHGLPLDNELRFLTAQGDVRIFHSRAIPITDASGRVVSIYGMSQDVTERRNKEERLRKNEALLTQAEQLANVGSWEREAGNETLTWSAHFCQMLGFEPRIEHLPCDFALTFIHPDDRQRAIRDMEELQSHGTPLDNELRFFTAHGDLRIFHSRAIRIEDAIGRRVLIRGMSQDVTESRNREERLRKSEALLSQAGQMANFGCWEYDYETDTAVLSKQLLRMYGMQSEGEWTREKYWKCLHPMDRGQAWKAWELGIAECKPYEYVSRYIKPDGSIQVHSVLGLPSSGPDGKTVRTIGVVQDITDHVRAGEDLRHLSQRLMRVRDDERRHMARELHESAGQTLAALKMTLGQLRDGLRNNEMPVFGPLRSAMDLTDEAIREVRTVSYLMHPPLLDDAGLGPALRWYAEGFSKRSGIETTVDVPEELGRHAQTVETTVFRIVQEALTNVHRYSGSRAAKILLARENGKIRLEVQDQGCGLTMRSPAATRQTHSGVGIPGIRERVNQLNGVFELESAPGRGTTVRAILPVEPPPEREHADAPNAFGGQGMISGGSQFQREDERSAGNTGGAQGD